MHEVSLTARKDALAGLSEYASMYGSGYISPSATRAKSIAQGNITDSNLLNIFFNKYSKYKKKKALSTAWLMWGGDSMRSQLLKKNPHKKSNSNLDIDFIYPDDIKKKNSSIKQIKDLISAKEKSQKYVDTFEAPTLRDLRNVSPGDFVKLSVPGYRFWVKVTGYEGKKIQGYVSNYVKCALVSPQDNIYFYSKHIYDIIKKA